jgi:RHS repeat-associated protein
LPNSSSVIYKYSADGDRLNKTSATGTILYLYDGDNILMDLDQSGVKTALYAYGPIIDEPIFMVRSGISYYYHVDYLGSIRVLTDANENIVATYLYDAFGTILQETGGVKNPYRFTAREWDVESGLYFYRARYYDAVLGRFLQKDPEGMVDGPNLYTYVGNSPTNYKDPTGRIFLAYKCLVWYEGWRIKCYWWDWCRPVYGKWCVDWELFSLWRTD